MVLDADLMTQALAGLFAPGRTRPFHWVTEGPGVVERMLALLCECGVVAHVTVHYPTGRKRQERARADALSELIPLLTAEGATELIIESRSEPEDGRDRQHLIDIMRDLDDGPTYRWEPKQERLLWIADAICGAIKEYLLEEATAPFVRLHAAGVLGELRYRTAP